VESGGKLQWWCRVMVVLPPEGGGGKRGCYKYEQTFENIIAHRGHYSGRPNWNIYDPA